MLGRNDYTPWKFNIAPENLQSQKETSLFSGAMLNFREGNGCKVQMSPWYSKWFSPYSAPTIYLTNFTPKILEHHLPFKWRHSGRWPHVLMGKMVDSEKISKSGFIKEATRCVFADLSKSVKTSERTRLFNQPLSLKKKTPLNLENDFDITNQEKQQISTNTLLIPDITHVIWNFFMDHFLFVKRIAHPCPSTPCLVFCLWSSCCFCM